MYGLRPIGVLGAMLGQAETECVTPDGRPGFIDFDGSCVPTGAQLPDDPQLGPGGQPLPPDFVAPGPTELHPDRWDLDSSPCTYTVAYGDTYVGIAKSYLDPSGQRWREVWEPNRATHPNPDLIYPGDVIVMPKEACDNMRRWLNRGGPSNVNPADLKPTAGDTVRKYGAVAAVLAAAAGLYWMS